MSEIELSDDMSMDFSTWIQHADKMYTEHQKTRYSKNRFIIIAISLFIAFSISSILFVKYYKTASEKTAEINTLTMQLVFVNETNSLNEAIIKWNEELHKPLKSLKFEDFSADPINGTPERFISPILKAQYKYSIPASLLSAQLWVETKINEESLYFGKSNGSISNVKQAWNTQRKAFDVYVKYFNGNGKWYLYKGEASFGAAQINIGYNANDKIRIEDAMNIDYSTDFVGNKWDYLRDYYKNESPFFIAMAYNNVTAAINGKEYLAGYAKKKEDVKSAKFIINYGEDVVTVARNQKLIEIYQNLFEKYKGRDGVPNMKLWSVDQNDYRQFVGY